MKIVKNKHFDNSQKIKSLPNILLNIEKEIHPSVKEERKSEVMAMVEGIFNCVNFKELSHHMSSLQHQQIWLLI